VLTWLLRQDAAGLRLSKMYWTGVFLTTRANRSLGRKPVTSMERAELIEALKQPKIHREYVLGFLVQDNCPECRGQDIGCKCVLASEVMLDPPVAPASRAAAMGSNFEVDEL
jgi:hypothetical protein